jgi:hypothetical protein
VVRLDGEQSVTPRAPQPLRRPPECDALGATGAHGVTLALEEGPGLRAAADDFEIGEGDDHSLPTYFEDCFIRCEAEDGIPSAAA